MSGKQFVVNTVALLLAVLVYGGVSSCTKGPGDQVTFSPAAVADYVHAVIEADRTFYTVNIVERLQAKGVITATEHWRVTNTLPLPAQFLRESADLAARTGSRIGYRLISLWPINKQNGPADEFEGAGLQDVLVHQERAYSGIATIGGVRYFRAIYADRAVSQACIGCHNAHQSSPKRDFKQNDVMGGIVISIPLEKS